MPGRERVNWRRNRTSLVQVYFKIHMATDTQIKGATRDLASMIRGSGHYPPSTLASETSAHGHSGSITEDFVSGLFTRSNTPSHCRAL